MKDTTEIIVVMDKSGSMHPRSGDAIGGFNSFLEDQKKEPGEANLTLVLFDTTYSIPINGKSVREVEPLNMDTYRPSGNTALNDALGRAITETGKRLKEIPEDERPEKVICVVITDGQENSSVEHSKAQIKDMVKHQEEKYDWAFLYLGIEIDAFEEVWNLGFDKNQVCDFHGATASLGTYSAASRGVSSYRKEGKAGLTNSKWKDKP